VNQVKLLEGGLAVDDRGKVAFVNDFNLNGVKRFYSVSNHRCGFVRAWHAHRNEAKFVHVVGGSALVGAVRIDDWEQPAPDLPVQKYVLTASRPAVLYIPAGFANGFMTLTDDAVLLFFSTSTVEESKGDDFRFPARHWDPWHVEER